MPRVPATRSVPTPRTTLARTSRYVLAKSRKSYPVHGVTNYIGLPEVVVLPSHRLLYTSASMTRRKGIRFSHPHTSVDLRTSYYENTSVRYPRLTGVTRRRGAACFIRFTRLPGGGVVLERLCLRFLPAAVALRFAAFLTFIPATTSPTICAPAVSERFPKATSPRLIRGATVRRRPLNKLPNPCPLWTRAPE